MSLFGFRSKKTAAPAVPAAPPPDFVQVLIARRGRFPALDSTPGQSKALARQLDVTLMKSGFKLSPALLAHLGGRDFDSVLSAAQTILHAVRQSVGDHVKHNSY